MLRRRAGARLIKSLITSFSISSPSECSAAVQELTAQRGGKRAGGGLVPLHPMMPHVLRLCPSRTHRNASSSRGPPPPPYFQGAGCYYCIGSATPTSPAAAAASAPLPLPDAWPFSAPAAGGRYLALDNGILNSNPPHFHVGERAPSVRAKPAHTYQNKASRDAKCGVRLSSD